MMSKSKQVEGQQTLSGGGQTTPDTAPTESNTKPATNPSVLGQGELSKGTDSLCAQTNEKPQSQQQHQDDQLPSFDHHQAQTLQQRYDEVIEAYKKQHKWDPTKPYDAREFHRPPEERKLVYSLIHSLMMADIYNRPEKMHDFVTVLITMKVITVFRLLHMDHALDRLNDEREFHGDKRLIRFFLGHVIKPKPDQKGTVFQAQWIGDILFVTSHRAWESLFAAYTLPKTFPPKTLALCKIRTTPHTWLLPIQQEVLKYGVELTAEKHGPISITKKRKQNLTRTEASLLEQSIIREAAMRYTSIHSTPQQLLNFKDTISLGKHAGPIIMNGFYGMHQLQLSTSASNVQGEELKKIREKLEAISQKLNWPNPPQKSDAHAGPPSKPKVNPTQQPVNLNVHADANFPTKQQQPNFDQDSQRPKRAGERSQSAIDSFNGSAARDEIANTCTVQPPPNQQDAFMKEAHQMIPTPNDSIEERMHKNTFWYQQSKAPSNGYKLQNIPCHNHLRGSCRFESQCQRQHIMLPHHVHGCCSFFNHLQCRFGNTCRKPHHDACMRETQKLIQSVGLSSQQLFTKNTHTANNLNPTQPQFNF